MSWLDYHSEVVKVYRIGLPVKGMWSPQRGVWIAQLLPKLGHMGIISYGAVVQWDGTVQAYFPDKRAAKRYMLCGSLPLPKGTICRNAGDDPEMWMRESFKCRQMSGYRVPHRDESHRKARISKEKLAEYRENLAQAYLGMRFWSAPKSMCDRARYMIRDVDLFVEQMEYDSIRPKRKLPTLGFPHWKPHRKAIWSHLKAATSRGEIDPTKALRYAGMCKSQNESDKSYFDSFRYSMISYALDQYDKIIDLSEVQIDGKTSNSESSKAFALASG